MSVWPRPSPCPRLLSFACPSGLLPASGAVCVVPALPGPPLLPRVPQNPGASSALCWERSGHRTGPYCLLGSAHPTPFWEDLSDLIHSPSLQPWAFLFLQHISCMPHLMILLIRFLSVSELECEPHEGKHSVTLFTAPALLPGT